MYMLIVQNVQKSFNQTTQKRWYLAYYMHQAYINLSILLIYTHTQTRLDMLDITTKPNQYGVHLLAELASQTGRSPFTHVRVTDKISHAMHKLIHTYAP